MTLQHKKSSEKGFTIVELLIVIIVIGILATLVLIAYNNVQAQARDTKRQADASSLREASESFKIQSTTSAYPVNTAAGFASDLNNGNGTYPSKTVVISTDITNQIVNAADPNASAPNTIRVTYCGGTDPGTATGQKFTYYSEVKKATAFFFTGTGC